MTCPSDVSSVRSFQHNSGELDRATRPWQCLDFVDPFGYQPDSKLRCFTCGSWKSLVAKGWHLSAMIEVTTRELGEMPPSTVATQIEGIVLHTCQVTAGK